MPTLTEKPHTAEAVIYEEGANYSRDMIIIVAGSGIVRANTVLGKITASGKYKPSTATGSDGGQTAVAMNLYEVDATSADQKVAAITREAILNVNCLTYDASVDDGTKRAAKATQLAAVGIIVR